MHLPGTVVPLIRKMVILPVAGDSLLKLRFFMSTRLRTGASFLRCSIAELHLIGLLLLVVQPRVVIGFLYSRLLPVAFTMTGIGVPNLFPVRRIPLCGVTKVKGGFEL